MRIIAGKHRGTQLTAPEDRAIRPTSDRARESLYNVLAHRYAGDLAGARVLDVFAGTGALGLEALSRGASHVTFLDRSEAALPVIQANVRRLRAEGAATLLRGDALKPPVNRGRPCSLVFLDPPYEEMVAEEALRALVDRGWIASGALCIVETAAKTDVAAPDGFELLDTRSYGKAKITFLRHA